MLTAMATPVTTTQKVTSRLRIIRLRLTHWKMITAVCDIFGRNSYKIIVMLLLLFLFTII